MRDVRVYQTAVSLLVRLTFGGCRLTVGAVWFGVGRSVGAEGVDWLRDGAQWEGAAADGSLLTGC